MFAKHRGPILQSVISISAVIALAASAGLQPKPEAPPYQMKLEFTPTSDASDTVQTPVNVAVIDPAWPNAKVGDDADMKKFKSALSSAITESLSAKKMTVKGTFPDVAEMAFADKKATQLAILTELQIDVVCDAKPTGIAMTSNGQTWNDYSIDAGTTGSVLIKVVEPQSKELLWQKRVELDKVVNQVKTRSTGGDCYAGSAGWSTDVRNAMLKSVDKQYSVITAKLDSQLSHNEMSQLSKQADEIKGKKVY